MAVPTAPEQPDEHVRDVARALVSFLRTVRIAERRMRRPDSTVSTSNTILSAIAQGVVPPRTADLAAFANVDPSVVSRVLSQLEADKMISRERDPEDNRCFKVTVTDRGVHHITQRQDEAIAVVADLLSRVDEDLSDAPRILRALESTIHPAIDAAGQRKPESDKHLATAASGLPTTHQ